MTLASSWIVYTEVVLALLPGLANAYVDPFIFEAFNGARPNLPLQTAAPTNVPRYQREEYRTLSFEDLEIRQDAQTTDEIVLTITYAQDSTCGFISTASNSPIVCQNGGTCYWEVKSVGAVACASGPNGEAGSLYTSCIEGSNENCDANCQANTYNLLCTNANSPYCRTYTFPEGVVDFECISTSDSEIIAIDSTYDGQANAFFGTTVISDDGTSSGGGFPTSFSVITVTATPTPSPSPKPKPKSSTPVGAIVGGVVGGLALIVILVLGIFFMRRRSNKKNNGGDGGTIVAPVDPSQPPPQQQQWQQPVSQIYQPQSPPPAAAYYKGEGPPDRNMTYSPGSTTLGGMPSPGGTVSYMSPSSPDPHHSVVYEMEDSAAPTHRELPA